MQPSIRLHPLLRTPVYPLLLAASPVLSLMAQNLGQVHASAGVRPLLLSVASASLLLLALSVVLANRDKAAALVAMLVLLFFSYGHLYGALRGVEVAGLLLGRHRLLIPVLALLALLLSWRAHRSPPGPVLTAGLNVVAATALALPLLQIGVGLIRQAQGSRAQSAPIAFDAVEAPQDSLPDVYLILLDAYTRADVLSARFGVDNTPFIAELESNGFEVYDCAVSNYNQTELTLASLLNLEPIQSLLPQADSNDRDRTDLLLSIRDSRLRRGLESLGYETYAFETGYLWSEWRDADHYISPAGGQGGTAFPGPNAFESLLLETTAWPVVDDFRLVADFLPESWRSQPAVDHRRRTEFALERLPRLAAESGPKFVFAHLVIPHRPYLFSPEEAATAERFLSPDFPSEFESGYVAGYRNQVLYLNEVVPGLLERIQLVSQRPTAMLVFGDHGADDADVVERFPILLALKLPAGASYPAGEHMTPLGAVHAVLEQGFGLDLPLPPTGSFSAPYDYPFDFTPMTVPCPIDG